MKNKPSSIALNLPDPVPELIVFGRHVVLCMTNNLNFPSPNPPLALVSQHIDELEAAEVAAQARTKGAAAVRNAKRKVVESDLGLLKGYVGWVASQSPDPIAVIESAGMSAKQFSNPKKPPLQATMGPAPGQVVVRARAAGKGSVAYEWQFSADGGQTWIAIGLTNGANTSVSGLTVGKTYLFRFRTTMKNVTSDWSQPAGIFVH